MLQTQVVDSRLIRLDSDGRGGCASSLRTDTSVLDLGDGRVDCTKQGES